MTHFKQKIGHRLPYIYYLYKGLHHTNIKIYVNKLWSHQAQIVVKSFVLISSNLCHSARFKICLVTWPIVMSLSHDIAIVVAWIPSDCLEIKKSNVHSNKLNYWWNTLGIWRCESRNSSPWRYKFKKSRDKNKKNLTRSVFCSTRPPPPPPHPPPPPPPPPHPTLRNHQGKSLSSFGLRVSVWWFLWGFWLNRIPHLVFFIIVCSHNTEGMNDAMLWYFCNCVPTYMQT